MRDGVVDHARRGRPDLRAKGTLATGSADNRRERTQRAPSQSPRAVGRERPRVRERATRARGRSVGGFEELGDGGDELIDEESLLEPGDFRAGPIEYEGGGKSKKGKACKNCSCGRAEMEAAQEKAEAEQNQAADPESACGRCTMGDAFRCATCPSRGLPAGERKTVNVDAASQKVTLSASLLAADI